MRTNKYIPLLLFSCLVDTSVAQTQGAGLLAGEIYKKESPAVVLIELYNEQGKVSKTGSGFLVSADGKIITNYHVIAHSKQATVRLANKDAYDRVDVLDTDKRKDLALIKIRGSDLPFVALGKSSSVEIGDTVFSLSNPLGLFENTLSQGIVSGIRLGDGYKYFQVTAPISRGSSGGPIFNVKGEVIGVAVATAEEGQNLNFAVPVDYAKGMLSSTQAQPLSAIYEPEPEPDKTAVTATAAPKAEISDEMKKSSFVYLGTKLHQWTEQDARKELGDPLRQRDAFPAGSGTIYAYADPTNAFREFELNFDVKTQRLHDAFAYPWNLTWEDCKKLWGDDVRVIKNPNGTRFYQYKNRHINVLARKNGDVISIGVF